MDAALLRIYQMHVAVCCRAVLFAMGDLKSPGAYDNGRVWYAVPNLVIAAGNVSKALWGTGNEKQRARRYAERQPLRDSLRVTDDSPLRHVKIRNDYEHIDERIEDWWRDSPNHNIVDSFIGPRGDFEGIDDNEMLRWIDPSTGDVIFWGNELNIPTVVAEVQRILPIAERESQKPLPPRDDGPDPLESDGPNPIQAYYDSLDADEDKPRTETMPPPEPDLPVSDLVVDAAITAKVISDRVIVGPAVLYPRELTRFVKCTFEAPDGDSMFCEIPATQATFVGAIPVDYSTFTRCTFKDVGVAGPASEREIIRSFFS